MTLAFDAFTAPTPGTGDLSWTHTPVGTPRGVIVYVVSNINTDEISGVTYGGNAMTEATGSPHSKAGGEASCVHAFEMLSGIPTGNQTVYVTTTGTTGGKAGGCITLTGAADTEVQEADVTINSNALDDPRATLALGGNSCFCCIGFFSGRQTVTLNTPLTSWTNRYNHDYGVATMGIYTYDTIGTTDVTAGWDNDVADDVLAIALAIKEVAGAAGEPPRHPAVYNDLAVY